MLYNFLKSIHLMVPKFIKKSVILKEDVIIYTSPDYLVPLMTFLKAGAILFVNVPATIITSD